MQPEIRSDSFYTAINPTHSKQLQQNAATKYVPSSMLGEWNGCELDVSALELDLSAASPHLLDKPSQIFYDKGKQCHKQTTGTSLNSFLPTK